MDRELARKQPATIVQSQEPAPEYPRTVILQRPFHERGQLIKEVHQMARRGEIGAAYQIRETRHGWAVKVIQIRPRASWVRRHAGVLSLAGVGMVMLGGMIYVLILALQALAAALVGLLPFALVVLAILALTTFLSALGGSVNVIQKVTIKR